MCSTSFVSYTVLRYYNMETFYLRKQTAASPHKTQHLAFSYNIIRNGLLRDGVSQFYLFKMGKLHKSLSQRNVEIWSQ